MNARVLIIGGSKEYAGTLYLAGVAALRAGAESVIVMAPKKVAWALNALSPDLVTRKLKGEYLSFSHKKIINQQLKTADILLVGNGATTKSGPASLMRYLMKWSGLKVIDADALKVLKQNQTSNAILTPNKGEWALLQKHNSIPKLLSQKIVIIKKSRQSEIISKGKRFKVKQTNRGLEKAGMGDVLAGLCAGFLAKGFTLWQAASKSAQIGNQTANLLTKKKKGYVFLASDLVQEIRKVKK